MELREEDDRLRRCPPHVGRRHGLRIRPRDSRRHKRKSRPPNLRLHGKNRRLLQRHHKLDGKTQRLEKHPTRLDTKQPRRRPRLQLLHTSLQPTRRQSNHPTPRLLPLPKRHTKQRPPSRRQPTKDRRRQLRDGLPRPRKEDRRPHKDDHLLQPTQPRRPRLEERRTQTHGRDLREEGHHNHQRRDPQRPHPRQDQAHLHRHPKPRRPPAHRHPHRPKQDLQHRRPPERRRHNPQRETPRRLPQRHNKQQRKQPQHLRHRRTGSSIRQRRTMARRTTHLPQSQPRLLRNLHQEEHPTTQGLPTRRHIPRLGRLHRPRHERQRTPHLDARKGPALARRRRHVRRRRQHVHEVQHRLPQSHAQRRPRQTRQGRQAAAEEEVISRTFFPRGRLEDPHPAAPRLREGGLIPAPEGLRRHLQVTNLTRVPPLKRRHRSIQRHAVHAPEEYPLILRGLGPDRLRLRLPHRRRQHPIHHPLHVEDRAIHLVHVHDALGEVAVPVAVVLAPPRPGDHPEQILQRQTNHNWLVDQPIFRQAKEGATPQLEQLLRHPRVHLLEEHRGILLRHLLDDPRLHDALRPHLLGHVQVLHAMPLKHVADAGSLEEPLVTPLQITPLHGPNALPVERVLRPRPPIALNHERLPADRRQHAVKHRRLRVVVNRPPVWLDDHRRLQLQLRDHIPVNRRVPRLLQDYLTESQQSSSKNTDIRVPHPNLDLWAC